MTASRRWRVALASAASAAVLIGAPLIGAQAASAQPYPPTAPPLTVSATTVTAGEPLSFSTDPGVFPPGALVTALLESKPVVLGRFRAEDDGSVAGTVTIPENTVNGWHVFRLTTNHPTRSVGVSIFVQGGVAPTPKPTHKPSHHPGKPGQHHDPRHEGHDDGRNESHAAVDPADNQHPDQNSETLAATGGDEALMLGGTAAALLVAGGGAALAVRRRRNS